MTLKNLFVAGILGVLALSGAKAAPYQTLVSQEGTGEVVLVSTWCQQHPHHRSCHRRDVRPFDWYHDSYREKANYCRHHPYRDGCHRFCQINPGVCFY